MNKDLEGSQKTRAQSQETSGGRARSITIMDEAHVTGRTLPLTTLTGVSKLGAVVLNSKRPI